MSAIANPPENRYRRERLFYLAMTVAIFAAVFTGFARSFFLRPAFPEWTVPPETFFYVHGTLFAAWFVLLMVQPLLIAAGRRGVHRALGRAGAGLALLMVLSGLYGAALAAARPGGFIGVPVPPLLFLVVPVFDMILFAVFVTLALRAVRDLQSHKRWMLIASVALIGAAIARWPLAEPAMPPLLFVIQDAFLLPLFAWDMLTRGKPHRVTVIGALVLVASQPLRLAIMDTAAWLAFAGWLTALVS